jgi:transposase
LKRGSVTITEHSVSVAFSKEVPTSEAVGYIGMDINERNVTVSATNGYERKFTELCEVVEIKERYRVNRSRIGRKTRGDRRIGKALLANYVGERRIERRRGFTGSPRR